MAKFELPILETQVDTNEPADSASNVAFAVIGVAGTIGVLAGGQFVYNKIRALGGVGSENADIPGV